MGVCDISDSSHFSARVVLDRASSALDPALQQLDSNPLLTTHVAAAASRDHAHLDRKQAPPPAPGAPPPSLTDVLNNIQNLRRFCFRPRPGPDQRGRGFTQDNNTLTCRLSPERGAAPGERPCFLHLFSLVSHLDERVWVQDSVEE